MEKIKSYVDQQIGVCWLREPVEDGGKNIIKVEQQGCSKSYTVESTEVAKSLYIKLISAGRGVAPIPLHPENLDGVEIK